MKKKIRAKKSKKAAPKSSSGRPTLKKAKKKLVTIHPTSTITRRVSPAAKAAYDVAKRTV